MQENTANKLEELNKAGVVVGHNTSRRHPKMKPYISRVKGFIDIIDANKTQEKLVEAIEYLKGVVAEGKTVLVVGTKVQAREMVKEFATACNMPYVNERWIGGTISNFPVIKKRVNYLVNLEKQQERGELEKYSNKERSHILKEMTKIQSKMGGLKNLNGIPDVLLILDICKDSLAVKEAKDNGVKVIGVVDTNSNPSLIDYPIPASDDAPSAIKFVLDEIQNIISKIKPAPTTTGVIDSNK
jgi:small subunit ribosomal protein S2